MAKYLKATPNCLEVQENLINCMVDVTGADVVQVSTDKERTRLWVNVNGVCLLRVCRIEQLETDDIQPLDGGLLTALRSDLTEAAATLRRYESYHLAKNTDESREKAAVNAALAERFEKTLARKE